MNENWEIYSLRGSGGNIETVEYSCELTHPGYPGVSERTSGIVPIAPLDEEMASRELIAERVKDFIGEVRWQEILAFTEHQLSILHTMQQGEQISADRFNEPKPITSDMIDAERDRRTDAGFVFNGIVFQSRPQDRENIAGAATAAVEAIGRGVLPGDYRWSDPDQDFLWIAADNSIHPMDAQTMFEFAKAALAHKQAHIFAARALKDALEIPTNYTADAHWPPRPINS